VGDGWVPPSGTVDPGESLLDALRRELREETTLEVNVERLIGIYSDPAHQIVSDPDGREIHLVTSLLACRPRESGGADRSFLAWSENPRSSTLHGTAHTTAASVGASCLPLNSVRNLRPCAATKRPLGLDAWPRTAMIKQL